jgi:hypothetical protein
MFTHLLQHLPVTIQNHHTFHQAKLLSLVKKESHCGTEVRSTQTCYSNRSQNSRELLQYIASSFTTSPKCRTLPHSLATLPRAVSLERISHGLNQARMLTNTSHGLPWEQRRLVHVHNPSKLSKPICNKLTKIQQLQNIKNEILLSQLFITVSRMNHHAKFSDDKKKITQ